MRYVGVTHGRTRLNEHVFSVKRKRTHVAMWVKSLLQIGLKPLLEPIEQGQGSDWAEREKFWIAEYRQQGARLTNHTLGGEGALGWSPDEGWRRNRAEITRRVHTGMKRSPEARARMSEAQKRYHEGVRSLGVKITRPPKSIETLERMAAAQRGKKVSEETRAKLSEAHRNPSTEVREKLAEAARNRPPEWKAWFAQNQKGKPKSAEHRAKIAAAKKKLNLSEASGLSAVVNSKAGVK